MLLPSRSGFDAKSGRHDDSRNAASFAVCVNAATSLLCEVRRCGRNPLHALAMGPARHVSLRIPSYLRDHFRHKRICSRIPASQCATTYLTWNLFSSVTVRVRAGCAGGRQLKYPIRVAEMICLFLSGIRVKNIASLSLRTSGLIPAMAV
jgi:hypothetical protein